MGWAKKRINPKILNHVNRNFNKRYTKAVIKAVQQLPLPWKPSKRGRKGHDLKGVAAGCILKVGFNQTYDGIEAYLKESETFKQHFDDLPGHSVIHRGMQKLSIKYIRKVMNRVTRFLRRKGMNIAVDSSGFRTGNSSPPSKVVSNQSGTLYNPGVFDFNTTYYWQIVAWDNHGTSTLGPMWNFTTMGIPPEISDVALTVSDPLDTDQIFGWENFTCTVTDNSAVDEV